MTDKGKAILNQVGLGLVIAGGASITIAGGDLGVAFETTSQIAVLIGGALVFIKELLQNVKKY